jgi:zinc/manganese transport system permease protein
MNSAPFSWNIAYDVTAMLHYDFMLHAFEAGTIVAVVAGVVGYFIVLRKSSFAAHALSHVGFTGAAGAVLNGLTPIFGLLAFTIGGGLLIATLGSKASERDVQIGTVLAFMLGLGVLFISLYSGYATEAYSILFGEILGISSGDVLTTAIAGIIILLAIVAIYRPLLFMSLDQDVAEAKGVPVYALGIIFMMLVGATTAISVQVVGVLLIFSLLVTPAAVAARIARRPWQGICIAVGIALVATWTGLFLAFYLPYPVSFFITTLTFAAFVISRFF